MYEPIEQALSRGDLLEAFELAKAALNESSGRGLEYRLVLALARMGATRLAQDYLVRFNLASDDDIDCQALEARLIKDQAFQSSGQERQSRLGIAAAKYMGVTNYANLQSHAVISGNDTLFTFDDGSILRVANVRPFDLAVDGFVFI